MDLKNKMMMLRHLKKKEESCKTRIISILIVVIMVTPMDLFTQNTKTSKSTVEITDTINFYKKKDGLLGKLLQSIRFKENRESKELNRVYALFGNLIKSGDLKIDSTRVKDILQLLDSIDIATNSKITNLNYDLSRNTKRLEALKIKVIDSLKVDLDSIIELQLKRYFVMQHKIEDSIEVSIKELRLNQYTCKCLEENRNNSPPENGSLCLTQKKKIIGWHNSWSKTEYKNYNYNYLSAINLYGYHLAANGLAKNEDEMDSFKKEGGVIEFAKNKCTDVHLTVYNKYPVEIAQFLRDQQAQSDLFSELLLMVTERNINGVNIYFEDVAEEDGKLFEQFIYDLYDRINQHELKVSLNLTIPSIYDNKSLLKISAYNFSRLNSRIDSYLVSTDRMTNLNNKWSQSSSPLFNDDFSQFGTIESTVNFYSNGKIPLSKIIVSVSYLGISWPLDTKSGEVVRNGESIPYYLKYNEILSLFRNNKDLKKNLEIGFDSIQVAAYLNLKGINGNNEITTQIWYENKESLRQKYNWIVAKNLAGVSIRGLGYDDGYSDLWDVLGTSLLKVDTLKIKDSLSPGTHEVLKRCKYEYSSDSTSIKLTNFDSIKQFWSFFQPFDSIGGGDKIEGMSFFQKVSDDIIWASQPSLVYKTESYIGTNLEKKVSLYPLNDKETCECLIERWLLYTAFSFYGAGICAFFIILLRFRINYIERFNKGSKFELIIDKSISSFLIILCLLLVLFGIYMAPWLDLIGASNDGNVSIGNMIILAIIGVFIGWYINKNMNKGKLFKNLP
jgi:spore germination protein YaaH